MSFIFGSPKMPQLPPEPPQLASAENEEAVKKAAEDERQRIRLMRGRSSTILTGGTGVIDNPMLMRKTLLGGT